MILNVFGQQTSVDVYTQICFCYSLADASSHSAIISKLTNGLKRLTASFPWIAGQVVNEGASEGNSGVFKIKSLEDIPYLVVKDLRHDGSMPTMDTLRQAGFPISMLDESIIAPRRTIPGTADEPESDTKPVFALQANFVTGGLLLTFVSQHNVMDMAGQGQMTDLLSKSCRDEQFSNEELSSGDLFRHNIIALLDQSYKPGLELARQLLKPTNEQSAAIPPPPPKCIWTYIVFQSTSLTTLKSLASSSNNLATAYISTDDVLSAFLWQSILRARIPRLKSTVESTFARAVDARRYLNIPQTYAGLVTNMVYHTFALQELIEKPLGDVASLLRMAVDPETSSLGYDTRALATILDRSVDKSVVSVTASIDPSTDVMLSSWAKMDFYELDFGLGLGKPESLRRPQFTPFEGLLYLMPRAPNGEIAVAMCLRDEDMARLKADQEFAKYGRYVG